VIKKMIVGLVAVGAIVGLRSARKRIGHKMRDHCGEMAERCMEMAAQFARRGEAAGRT
jgi:hypothetical protein